LCFLKAVSMETTKYDVFISYSSKDYFDGNRNVIPNNVISRIKSHLHAAGISYWFDEEGIYEGDEYAPKLTRAIKSSAILLFVSSSNSNMSTWTRREIATAQKYGKIIIPFKIDASEYDESVDIWLAGINAIEFYKAEEKAFDRLMEVLQEHLKVIKAEQEHRLKEREKQDTQRKLKYENEQKELVKNIEQGVVCLDTDESNVDILRQRLQSNVQKIGEAETRERLTVLIDESGPIHIRQKNEMAHLNEEISRLTGMLSYQKRLQKLIISVCAFCSLLVGMVAGYYLRSGFEEMTERKAAQKLTEVKIQLTELSNKLTTIDFTVLDIRNLESFLGEHQEFTNDDDVRIAQDRIKIAGKLLELCSGNDYAADGLTGLSSVQEALLVEVKPRLNDIDQHSCCLSALKAELYEYDNRVKEFNKKCEALAKFDCSISQLTEIIDYGEDSGFRVDERYIQACNLRVCICALMGRNTRGKFYLNTSEEVRKTILNRTCNIPGWARVFVESIMMNETAYNALPLSGNFTSLKEIKTYLETDKGIVYDFD